MAKDDDKVIKGKFGPQGDRVYKGTLSEVRAQIKKEAEAYTRAQQGVSKERNLATLDDIDKNKFKAALMNKVKPSDSLKTVKLAGKALTRLIPYAGWALAAKEVYDIGSALYEKYNKPRKIKRAVSKMPKGQDAKGGGYVRSKYTSSNKKYKNGGKVNPIVGK